MKRVSKEEGPLLRLWESILTGRAAPLSKITKEKYADLGLNHIFTPSGFHLSAILSPLMKVIKHRPAQLMLLLSLGILLFFLPGLMALKRMLMIKCFQHLSNLHWGFIGAMILDLLLGSFQGSALSFTYSFLFLGIIYSGAEGIGLIIWFFIGQIIIAFFNGQDISPLLLIFSPILNLGFGIAMPILFLCAYPLTDFQLQLGLKLLSMLQSCVDQLSEMILSVPTIEVSLLTIIGIGIFIFRRWKYLLPLVAFYAHDLNLDLQKRPSYSTQDFSPQGYLVSSINIKGELRNKYSDGYCRVKLVRGFWWETCSPRYKRSRKKKT